MCKNYDIDKSSYISENCVLSGNIKIGKNCKIVNSRLNNCSISDNVEIIDSDVDGSEIKDNVKIGPYARIRPCTFLDENVKVGNFVEVKNAKIGKRTKIPHLSYVGDTVVGEDVNIGCGVIFCNYDGINKNVSYVGNRVFIGSNSNIVAPVIIEDESFIAAGTTVTDNVDKNQFCIGRVKNENKNGVLNLYLQNFYDKPKYFGTDGIRGIYGKELTDELCQKVGYALTKLKPNAKILIGKDTRPSGENMLNYFAKGVCQGGGETYFAGELATAGVAYLTKFLGFDFGVVLTASHNPSEYNGIKIFNKNGYKLNENQEILLENNLFYEKYNKKPIIKTVSKDAYFEMLKSICLNNVSGLKVFLDCSSGAVSSYAKTIFESLGVKVFAVNTSGEINKNSSVLNEQLFFDKMEQSGCDIGFCFDGDADRVMCKVKGQSVLNGDKILYLLSLIRKERYVVGTVMTNMAIEKELKKIGTTLIRTYVGDKYIARIMKSKKYKIGAEESGHVIIDDFTTTGDGMITALYLLNIYAENKQIFDTCSQLNMYSTFKKEIVTLNKNIIKSPDVNMFVKAKENSLSNSGRIIVRASGTEPKIRISVESENMEQSNNIANEIYEFIKGKLNE